MPFDPGRSNRGSYSNFSNQYEPPQPVAQSSNKKFFLIFGIASTIILLFIFVGVLAFTMMNKTNNDANSGSVVQQNVDVEIFDVENKE